jgi:NAD(P)-dependent dehydrogenase (short-subunit alcohol dehydrogenase family)
MTPVVGTMGPELQYFIDQGMHRTAMKRFAQPEEVANGITYLSSWMRRGYVGRWVGSLNIPNLGE